MKTYIYIYIRIVSPPLPSPLVMANHLTLATPLYQ